MEFLLIGVLCMLMFVVFQAFNYFIFNEERMEGKGKRLNKLRFNDKHLDKDDDLKQFIDKATNPFLFLVPQSYKENISLAKKLDITGFNNYVSTAQYTIINWFMKIMGVLCFVFLVKASFIQALIGFALFFFAPDFLLTNDYNEKKKRILAEFPNIIKSLSCFLNADLAFVDAIRNTLVYSKDIWRPYLKLFINDCEMYNQKTAINNICERLDIFEIKDFFTMVLLGLEKGINLKESFEMQSDRMNAMYRQSMLDIITKREMFATLIQAPMLLGIIVAFGLPLAGELLSFTNVL